jgi:formylglycine-generating enzyme required for sulfatase activity
VKVRGLAAVLAIAGSFGGGLACGARTGVEVFDEINNDGGQDAMLDSVGDVVVADVGRDAPSCVEAPDSGSLPPSCASGGPGMTNCGPGGSGSESCCTSLEVCSGTYFRTYTNDGGGPTGEADPATVSSFRLDKYLVTVARFRQFVTAWNGGYYPAANSGKHIHLNGGLGLANSANPGTYETGWDAMGWNNAGDIDPTDDNLAEKFDASSEVYFCTPATWTPSSSGGQENLPIDCVNWFEAYAFCIWDGGFLPSEAEWEYAAAGGNLEQEYPWGSTAPGTGNQYAIYGRYYTGNSLGIAPVGYASLGAGYWGQLDLAGELSEWNLDGSSKYYIDPCIDCAYLPTSPASYDRVVGSYVDDFMSPPILWPSHRASNDPTARTETGFRCARTP